MPTEEEKRKIARDIVTLGSDYIPQRYRRIQPMPERRSGISIGGKIRHPTSLERAGSDKESSRSEEQFDKIMKDIKKEIGETEKTIKKKQPTGAKTTTSGGPAVPSPTNVKYIKAIQQPGDKQQKDADKVAKILYVLLAMVGIVALYLFDLSRPVPLTQQGGWAILFIILVVGAIVVSRMVTKNPTNRLLGLLFFFIIVGVLLIILSSGWLGIIGETTSEVTGEIPTEGLGEAGSQISDVLSNIWLLLSNPSEWYTQNFATSGRRDVGATDKALEITRVEILPDEANPGDKVTLIAEIENQGQFDAHDVIIKGELDQETIDYGGIMENSDDESEYVRTINLGTIHMGEPRLQTFSIISPDCSGKTFSVKTHIIYNYTVNATNNIEFISTDFYEELLKQKKLEFSNPLSISSAGPFKLSIRTTLPQPIKAEKDTEFSIVLGIQNERDATALIKGLEFYVPKDILRKENTDNKKYSCDDFDDKGLTEDGMYRVYKLKKSEIEKDKTTEEDVGIESQQKGMIVGKNGAKYYTCEGFYYDEEGEGITQIRTLSIRTRLDYLFDYERETSFSTISAAIGEDKCSEKVEEVKQREKGRFTKDDGKTMVYTLTNKEDIIGAIEACRDEYSGSYYSEHKCGPYTISLDGCTTPIQINTISVKGIYGIKWDDFDNNEIRSDKIYRGVEIIHISPSPFLSLIGIKPRIEMDITSTIEQDNECKTQGQQCETNEECSTACCIKLTTETIKTCKSTDMCNPCDPLCTEDQTCISGHCAWNTCEQNSDCKSGCCIEPIGSLTKHCSVAESCST